MSHVERVNPAVRLLCVVVVSAPLLVSLDWVSAAVALACEIVACACVRVDLARTGRRLAPVAALAPLGVLSMVLYGDPEGRVWWRWGPMCISDGSLLSGAAMFVRILALALPMVVLLDRIDSTRLADGLAQVCRLPAEFVLGTMAGFRLVGLLLDDWRSLSQARRARGLGDDHRARRWATATFALLVIAIRRGTQLATAMEARAFGAPTARTWARPSRLGWPDAVSIVCCITIGAVSLAMAVAMGTLHTVLG